MCLNYGTDIIDGPAADIFNHLPKEMKGLTLKRLKKWLLSSELYSMDEIWNS